MTIDIGPSLSAAITLALYCVTAIVVVQTVATMIQRWPRK